MAKLDDDDWQLSMNVSRRSRLGAGGDEDSLLRSLLIHRLTPSLKAILRLPLRGGKFGLYCEACDRWTNLIEAPPVARCPSCERMFRLEMAIYEEIDFDE